MIKVQINDSMWFDNEKLRKLIWKHHKDSIPIYIGMVLLTLLVLLMYYIDTSF